ncbi:LysM peptidoglycan-binding domain-containing protein [Cellulomonas sp. 73-145]|uniref:LysM peptidoglycan-binding domain-containing protein n=1 Tax=Cellulomonas sp. 73-145 TaxID=1895739 RepID=UPI0025C23904|nr:LysM peptidoglycan-binding domain-containing protein [Cellulomonas sp. 73-145]
MTTTPTRPTRADLARGLGAAMALLGFVVGVPTALVALAPVYLPDQVPTWGQLWDRVMSPDDGSLLLAVLGAVAWATWAAFTGSVLVELAASARRVHAPRIPMLGGLQRTAARLIATAGLLVATTSAISTPASPAAASALVATLTPVAPADAAPLAAPAAPATTPTSAAAAPSVALPSITVHRGDTLWDLAERHLGDPLRYTEIRDLNTGRTQPDGSRLRDADFIKPGWTLLLPADATDLPPAVHTVASTAAGPSVVVTPGDTLWSIAAEHLGDGHRYPEIAILNVGITQSDGSHLSEPDTLRPGWVLRLPTTAPVPEPPQQPKVASAARPDLPPSPALSPAPTAKPAPTLTRTPSPADLTTNGGSQETATGTSIARAHEDERQAASAWFLGLAALGAAGIVGEIARRRHLQQRARRVGETIPMPEPTSPAASAERTLRTATTPVSIDAIRTTLHNLACRCFDAGRELPRVAALLLDEHHLTLLLLEERPDAAAPFTARNPRTWVAPTADVATEEAIDDPAQGTPYPLLVTLGHTEDATLILNLEAAGTLTVTGDDTTADEALRALVMEAATSDLASQLALHTDDPFADLTDAFEDFRLRATDERDERTGWAKSVSDLLATRGLADVHQARARRELDDVWLPIVSIESGLTTPPSRPWSGAVTLTRQDVDDAWTIRVDSAGMARLEPLDITFQTQRLTSEQADQLRALLLTSLPPEPHAANGTPATSAQDDVAALRRAHLIVNEPNLMAAGIRLNLLGPVQVEGIGGRPLTPRTVELLVYLALHGPASGPDLDEMIWKGERGNPNTRNVFIRRARERLGDGVLPLVDVDGLFRLGEGVRTDWARFQHHLAQAVAFEGQQQVDELAAAMALVRDRPFRGISPTAYVWADYDIQKMVGAIVDAAGILARIHQEAGRSRDAITVATLGLLVEPCSEELQTIAINATFSHSGPREAKSLRRRYSELMGRLDPELA